jgi:Skp family chaperone for outer membrane proteins
MRRVKLCCKKSVLFFCLFSSLYLSAAAQSSPSTASGQAALQRSYEALLPQLERASSLVQSLKLNQDSRDTLMQQRELRLQASEAELGQKKTDLDQRERTLLGREASLSRTEEALASLQISLDSASQKLKEASLEARRKDITVAVFRGIAVTAAAGLGGDMIGKALGNNTFTPAEIGLAVGAGTGLLWGILDMAHGARQGDING